MCQTHGSHPHLLDVYKTRQILERKANKDTGCENVTESFENDQYELQAVSIDMQRPALERCVCARTSAENLGDECVCEKEERKTKSKKCSGGGGG